MGTDPIVHHASTDNYIGARITSTQTSIATYTKKQRLRDLLAMTTHPLHHYYPLSTNPLQRRPMLGAGSICYSPPFTTLICWMGGGCGGIDGVPYPKPRLSGIASTQASLMQLLPHFTPLSIYTTSYPLYRYITRTESSTTRPVRGQGIDYGFVSTVDVEERRQGIRDVGYGIRDTWVDPAEVVPEIAPMTMGEVNTRVVELAESHARDTQDLYALLEECQDGRSRISQRVDMNSQRVDLRRGDGWTSQDRLVVEEEGLSTGTSRHTLQLQSTLIQTQHQVHETRFHMQQTEIAALRETDRRRQDQMVETLRVIRDMRREMSDMQAELLALREQRRIARQSGPEARIPDHQEASGDADSHI
ncbi:hypothetical protein Tco_1164865 [Tanacetum coccineum]